jgi:glycerophosphoryl diester phosphodiesterase
VYLLSPRLLRSIRRDGLFLGVWTVNEREAMQRMVEKGVHGIITDYPDVALEVTAQ